MKGSRTALLLIAPFLVPGLQADESEKPKTVTELGLRAQIVVSFQVAHDTDGFGVSLHLVNSTDKAIPGWYHTKSPTGLISIRLDQLVAGKPMLIDEHAFNPVLVLLTLHPQGDRTDESTLAPGRKAAVGAAISIANSNPKSEIAQLFDKQCARTPYEITTDGEYQILCTQKSTNKTLGIVKFTVMQAGTHPIVEIQETEAPGK